MHLQIWVYSIHYTDWGKIQHQLKRYGQNSAFSNSRGGVFTIEKQHPYPHLGYTLKGGAKGWRGMEGGGGERVN